jgi:hypothetical protein
MTVLESDDIDFLYIQGQHEYQPKPWAMAVHRWPTWLHDAQVQVDRWKIQGYDWAPRDQLLQNLSKVDKSTDLLVLHQVCHEFMGGVADAQLALTEIPYARRVLMGDYHKHVSHNTLNTQGHAMRVLSPGATHLTKIYEELPKRCFLLTDKGTVKSIELPHRPVHRPSLLQSEQDLEQLLRQRTRLVKQLARRAETLPGYVRTPILVIRYLETVDRAYDRLMNAFADSMYLFLEEEPAEPEPDELVIAEPAVAEEEGPYEVGTNPGMTACLPLVISDKDSEVYKATHRLLSSRGPAETLAELRRDYLGQEENEED